MSVSRGSRPLFTSAVKVVSAVKIITRLLSGSDVIIRLLQRPHLPCSEADVQRSRCQDHCRCQSNVMRHTAVAFPGDPPGIHGRHRLPASSSRRTAKAWEKASGGSRAWWAASEPSGRSVRSSTLWSSRYPSPMTGSGPIRLIARLVVMDHDGAMAESCLCARPRGVSTIADCLRLSVLRPGRCGVQDVVFGELRDPAVYADASRAEVGHRPDVQPGDLLVVVGLSPWRAR